MTLQARWLAIGPLLIGAACASAQEPPAAAWTAAGTEPFWSLRAEGDAAVLQELTESIDTTRYVADGPIAAAGRKLGRLDRIAVYFLTEADGAEATIVLRRAEPGSCSDGMSDEAYPWYAALVRGRRVYDGCARGPGLIGSPSSGEPMGAWKSVPPLAAWTTFSAFGDEPFWSLEVREDEATFNDRAVERSVVYRATPLVAAIGRTPDRFGALFLDPTSEGEPPGVLLLRQIGPPGCANMSGEALAYAAALILGDQPWVGCARPGG